MRKPVISARRVTIAAITAVALSLPIMSVAQAQQTQQVAQAQQQVASGTATVKPCKFFDTVSHRCLNFRSDSTFPEGLSDYHGTGGR
jgi:hypothetical protein